MDKKIKEVKNIKCDVKNCVYHTGDCSCMAGSIHVGSQDACSCGETKCSTFELNKDAQTF